MDSPAFRQITVKFFASLLSDMSSRCDSKEHLYDLHGLLGNFLGFLDRLDQTETGIKSGDDEFPASPSETIDDSSSSVSSDSMPVPAPDYYAVILKCIDAVLTCLVFMLSDAFSCNLPPNACDSWCDDDDELCPRDESTVPSQAYKISDDEGYDDVCSWSPYPTWNKCPTNSPLCDDDDDKDSYGLSSFFDLCSDDGVSDDEKDIYGLASLFDLDSDGGDGGFVGDDDKDLDDLASLFARLRLDSDDDSDKEEGKKCHGKAYSI